MLISAVSILAMKSFLEVISWSDDSYRDNSKVQNSLSELNMYPRMIFMPLVPFLNLSWSQKWSISTSKLRCPQSVLKSGAARGWGKRHWRVRYVLIMFVSVDYSPPNWKDVRRSCRRPSGRDASRRGRRSRCFPSTKGHVRVGSNIINSICRPRLTPFRTPLRLRETLNHASTSNHISSRSTCLTRCTLWAKRKRWKVHLTLDRYVIEI